MSNPAWVPGVSGNPNGRPRKGDSFSELLEKELKKRKYTIKEADGTTKKVNGKQAIIRAHLALIFGTTVDDKVKMSAIDSLMDRVDGRPKQAVEHSGAIGAGVLRVPSKMTPEEWAAAAEAQQAALMGAGLHE